MAKNTVTVVVGTDVYAIDASHLDTLKCIVAGMSGSSKSEIRTQAKPVAVAEPIVYDHVDGDFDDFVFVRKDNLVTYTHKDGKYLHEKAVRRILNAHLRNAGAEYNTDLKA